MISAWRKRGLKSLHLERLSGQERNVTVPRLGVAASGRCLGSLADHRRSLYKKRKWIGSVICHSK